MIRIVANRGVPHGAQAREVPKPSVPKAPREIIAVQREIKRALGELVPIGELLAIRAGAEPSLSTPRLAVELVRALPKPSRRRRVASAGTDTQLRKP